MTPFVAYLNSFQLVLFKFLSNLGILIDIEVYQHIIGMNFILQMD